LSYEVKVLVEQRLDREARISLRIAEFLSSVLRELGIMSSH